MPKPPVFPKFSVRSSDCMAYVTMAGRRIYLGRYDSDRAKLRYQAICARIAAGIADPALAAQFDDDATINELILGFLRHARGIYSRSEQTCLRYALEPLSQLFGDVAADRFGPAMLTQLRDHLAETGLVRAGVNSKLTRIKRFWKWASANELCDPLMHHRLACVSGLRRGQHGVPDSDPVYPACSQSIAGVLPYLPPTVAAMVRVQYLCGMRPQDVCTMRRCDLDERPDDVWLYYPASHKNEWRGQSLVKAVPLAAQPVLSPYLTDDREAYLFPSRRRRCYLTSSYRRAVERGFEKAEAEGKTLKRFSPNQLRHAILSDVEDLLSEKAAQLFAGHRNARSTKVYTQKQLERRAAELIAVANRLDQLWSARSA